MLYVVALCFASSALAQDNYEIQVYGAETLEPGSTMIELHSNFTMDGSKVPVDGTQPTNHALHETVEITQGFTPGSKPDSIYSPACVRERDGNTWATTSVRESAFRKAGTGRWA